MAGKLDELADRRIGRVFLPLNKENTKVSLTLQYPLIFHHPHFVPTMS